MISCASHDYVEIACLYGFEVKLVFKIDKVEQGKALQTTVNDNKEECLVLETDRGIEMIVLEQVASMEAITKNPHFEKIAFE